MENQHRTYRTRHWEQRKRLSSLNLLGAAPPRRGSVRTKLKCLKPHWDRPDSDGEVQRGMKEEERDREIERACPASIELHIREVRGNEVGRNSEQARRVHSSKWNQNKVRSKENTDTRQESSVACDNVGNTWGKRIGTRKLVLCKERKK